MCFVAALHQSGVVYARLTERLADTAFIRNSNSQYPFYGHSVRAKIIFLVGIAGARPNAVLKRDGMCTVVSAYLNCEVLELDAIGFIRILLCFSDFANNT